MIITIQIDEPQDEIISGDGQQVLNDLAKLITRFSSQGSRHWKLKGSYLLDYKRRVIGQFLFQEERSEDGQGHEGE